MRCPALTLVLLPRLVRVATHSAQPPSWPGTRARRSLDKQRVHLAREGQVHAWCRRASSGPRAGTRPTRREAAGPRTESPGLAGGARRLL
ncbi:hypothetical protein BJY59DRAFT_699567 [Rhodotorula toruloides]